jgi:hypothetical protein
MHLFETVPRLHSAVSRKALHTMSVDLLCPRHRLVADESTAFDPYAYTKGRWLDRDSQKRETREIRFNFDALLDIAVNSSNGACEVVSCEKKEGSFNRAFVILLDNGAKVVARLPNRLAGPPRLTLSSEAATMQYGERQHICCCKSFRSLLRVVRGRTNVPVPKVLAWSVEAEGSSVGAEYMVTEAVPGVLLKDVWSQMTGLQHIQCIQSIGKVAKELCSLIFTELGSLYFNDPDRPVGAIPLDETYCIGPNCARQHWGYDEDKAVRSNILEGRQGPCKSSLQQDACRRHTESVKGMT